MITFFSNYVNGFLLILVIFYTWHAREVVVEGGRVSVISQIGKRIYLMLPVTTFRILLIRLWCIMCVMPMLTLSAFRKLCPGLL